MTKPDINLILNKLERVRKLGKGYTALCPSHKDSNPSLSVSEGDEGRILIHCHAGCSVDEIVSSLGIDIQELFPKEDINPLDNVIATYPYHDENGILLYNVVRSYPKTFRAKTPSGEYTLNGIKRVPYKLPELLRADLSETVYIPEGEKHCDALSKLSLMATTNPFGAGKWKDEYSQYLKDRNVAILPDNDEPGQKHAEDIVRSLQGVAKSIKILDLPELPLKGDVIDWLSDGNTKEALLVLVEKAKVIDSSRVTSPIDTSVMMMKDGLPFRALSSFPLREVSYLIEDFIPSGFISTIFGDGGQGKSYLTLYIAALLSIGHPFLGRDVKESKVLYVDYELSDLVQRGRLDKIANGLGVSVESFGENLQYLTPGLNGITSSLREIISLLRRESFDLVVIDSTGAAFEGDPESARDVCNLLQELRALGSVVLLDHQSKKQRGDKSGDKSVFGSVYKQNLSRNVWHLNSVPLGENTLKCVLRHRKTNLSYINSPIYLELIFNEDSFIVNESEPGIELMDHLSSKELILLSLEELKEATAKEIAEDTDIMEGTVKNNISKLKIEGKIEDTGRKAGKASIYRIKDYHHPDCIPMGRDDDE